MKSNVLPFPQGINAQSQVKGMLKNTKEEGFKQASVGKMNDLDLMRLREAFDQARLSWPEEKAELPEKNKIHSMR